MRWQLTYLSTALVSLTVITATGMVQPTGQAVPSGTELEEPRSTPATPAFDPPPPGVIYRQWHLNEGERRLYADDRYGVGLPALLPPVRQGTREESEAKAQTVLNRLADFFSQQDTAILR